jgi:hypothetical protein
MASITHNRYTRLGQLVRTLSDALGLSLSPGRGLRALFLWNSHGRAAASRDSNKFQTSCSMSHGVQILDSTSFASRQRSLEGRDSAAFEWTKAHNINISTKGVTT